MEERIERLEKKLADLTKEVRGVHDDDVVILLARHCRAFHLHLPQFSTNREKDGSFKSLCAVSRRDTVIGSPVYGQGVGSTELIAEQKAAQQCLGFLKSEQ